MFALIRKISEFRFLSKNFKFYFLSLPRFLIFEIRHLPPKVSEYFKERQRLTKEKQELKERLESEMCELQGNIEHLQKMEKALKKESTKNGNTSEQQDALKVKLDVSAQNIIMRVKDVNPFWVP